MDNLKETSERVRDTAKETCADVVKIRLYLDHIIKEVIKVANRVQQSTGVTATSISNQFSILKTATVICQHSLLFSCNFLEIIVNGCC